MAEESINQQWKAIGNIIPSLSLNKHPRAVEDYSLIDAVNFRLSNDLTHLQLEESIKENNNIMSFLENNNYFPNGFEILHIYSFGTEVLFFVGDKSLDANNTFFQGRKYVTIVRYNELTNEIAKVYKTLTYYGGKFNIVHYYNVDGELIGIISQYDNLDKDVLYPLIYINLGKFENVIINNNGELIYNSENYKFFDEEYLALNPKIELSNMIEEAVVPGNAISGIYTFYIRYRLTDERLTGWYRLGIPLELSLNSLTTVFVNKTMGGLESATDPNRFNPVGILQPSSNANINKTISFKFNLDINYKKYDIGIVIQNATSTDMYVYKDLPILNRISEFIFNKDVAINEEFDFNNVIENYYNVKNILLFKNRLFISNYNNFIVNDYDIDSCLVYQHKEDISDLIKYYKSVADLSYKGISINTKDVSISKNLIWLFIALDIKKPGFNIFNKLINNTIYITYSYIPTGSPTNTYRTLKCDIKNVYYELNYQYFDYVYPNGGWQAKLRLYGTSDNYGFFDFTIDYAGNGNYLAGYPFVVFYNSQPTDYGSQDLNKELFAFSNLWRKIGENTIIQPRNSNYSSAFRNDVYIEGSHLTWYEAVVIHSSDTTYIYSVNLHGRNLKTWVEILEGNYLTKTFENTNVKKEFIYTSLVPNDTYDFYIQFFNDYGEISKLFKLSNIYSYFTVNDEIEFICIYYNSKWFYLKANILCGEYTDNIYMTYVAPNSNIVTNAISITKTDLLSYGIQYLDNADYKNLYTNVFANIGVPTEDGNTNFIPFYNGKNVLFKASIYPESVYNENSYDELKNYEVLSIKINLLNLPKNCKGYNLLISKIEPFFIKGIVGVENNLTVQLYNDTFNTAIAHLNSINSLRWSKTGHFSNDSKIIIPYEDTELLEEQYNFNDELMLAYAGESKYNRSGKSTILTNVSNISQNIYIGLNDNFKFKYGGLYNLNNNYYINPQHAYYLGDYIYDSEFIIKHGLYGKSTHEYATVFDEKGVNYNYTIDPNEVQSTSIDDTMKVKSLDSAGSEYITTRAVCIFDFEYLTNNYNVLYFSPNVLQIGKSFTTYPINFLDSYKLLFKNTINTIINYIDINYNPKYISNNQIIYSNIISDESKELIWTRFDVENYKIISSNYGKITNLSFVKNELLIHCENILYKIQFNNTLNSEQGNIIVKESAINDLPYTAIVENKNGYGGIIDKKYAIKLNNSYIFVDIVNKKIFKYVGNDKLVEISYNINNWLLNIKINEIILANNIEFNRILFNILYDDKFESRLLYNLNDINDCTQNYTYIYDKTTNKILSFIKHNFDKSNYNFDFIDNTVKSKISILVKTEYSLIKFLNSIYYKIYKYSNNIKSTVTDYTLSPTYGRNIFYPGDYIRIYNDIIDTGWIDVRNALNNKNDFTKPYYHLGNYHFNYFRNKEVDKIDNKYEKDGQVIYNESDDKSRLYGNFFVIEIAFCNSLTNIIIEDLKALFDKVEQ